MTITAIRIRELKQTLLMDCRRLAENFGCDLEGEMIRRGLCSPEQAELAMKGEVPRVSLAHMLNFTVILRESVWDHFADMLDDYDADADDEPDNDDEIPY